VIRRRTSVVHREPGSHEKHLGCKPVRHPSVSVVIPVKNRAEDLAVVLQSLSKQSLPFECVVVDQESSDGSAQVALKFGALVLNGRSSTVGGLRNEGISASTGTVIALTDSDHEVEPDWLECGLRALEQNPTVGIVGAPYLAPLEAGWVAKAWESHRRRGCQRLKPVTWLSAGNLFFRRADFERVQGFDTQLTATEDVDFCDRFARLGLGVILDPRIRNIHHGEPDSLIDFYRKQVWRGGHGWRAWCKHGYPLAELKSLVFPLWTVLGGLVILLLLLSRWFDFIGFSFQLILVLFVLWMLPSGLQSAKAAVANRTLKYFFPRILLYFVYGFARFMSLFGGSIAPVASPKPTSTDFDAHA
jgi:GT2 family glycosyltransferase